MMKALHLTCHSVTHKRERWIWFPLSYEGVAQARGCLRHETVRGVERWHCTICYLEFCAGFNDAKRLLLSTINTNSDLSFTTIQKQTYRRKQLMDQSDDNSLTALLTERENRRKKIFLAVTGLWGSGKVSLLASKKFVVMSLQLATVRVFSLLVFKCQHFACKICLTFTGLMMRCETSFSLNKLWLIYLPPSLWPLTMINRHACKF